MYIEGWERGIVAFGTAAVAMPIVCAVAERRNLYDRIGLLTIHKRPTPRLGGIGIFLGFLVGIGISARGFPPSTLYLFLALTTIWATGLADDLWRLSPATRLVAQSAAALLLWYGGWRLSLPGPLALSVLSSWLFVLVFVNAFNFLDGVDGLAAGVAAVVGLGYLLLGATGGSLSRATSWSLLGACLGFLIFNFPPAKLFMGDSGSTMLGFVIAFLGLDYNRVQLGTVPKWLVPLVLGGVPLLDLVFAIMRRVRKKCSPFAGDRQHFYDLLLQRGWSARQVALASYATTGALIYIGWLSRRADWSVVLIGAILVTLPLQLAVIRNRSLE
jgi:UDP-GlcNAc:undecaprenyl-phosphate/decaprenyl-phosphate GlcNAc-1-phosphate transferase